MFSDADHEVIDSPEALFRHLYEEHGVEEAADLDPETAPVQFWIRRHAELERAERSARRQPAPPPEPEPFVEPRPEPRREEPRREPRPEARGGFRLLRTDRGYRVTGSTPEPDELEAALRAAGAKTGAEVEVDGETLILS